MKWHCEPITTLAIEKMKRLYLSDRDISDVDLAKRFNIGVHRLRDLMKKEGVYKLRNRKGSRT